MARWINNVLWLGAGLALCGLAWLYYRVDPAQQFFPRCPFLTLTGYRCPGCGSQRAVHALLHGDLLAAARVNGLFVVALPYMLFGMLLEYTPWGRRKILLRRRWYGYRACIIVLVIVVGFWVLRNLL